MDGLDDAGDGDMPEPEFDEADEELAPPDSSSGESDVESAGSDSDAEGAEPEGAEPAGAEPAGAEPAGAEPAGAELAGAEPAGRPRRRPAEAAPCRAVLGRAQAPARQVVVRGDERRLSDVLGATEAAALLSVRAAQIADSGRCFSGRPFSTALQGALQELQERRCPLLLHRALGQQKGVEYVECWSPNDMILTGLDSIQLPHQGAR